MAVRPDPEVGYRRPGDHLGTRDVERRVFIQASPRVVWTTLHDADASLAIHPDLRLGPSEPTWPAASSTRSAETRIGLLRDRARVESLEVRPEALLRLRIVGTGYTSEWLWRLEPVAGGTRVVHAATFDPVDRWTEVLVRLGRSSLSSRVESHLRGLKEQAERAASVAASG